MIPIFFLIALDSLPPLPSPADLRLPEPAIQFDMTRDFLRAETYFGRYYGGGISCARSGFYLEAAYAHDEIWFAGKDGRIIAAAALPLKVIWLRPFFDGQWENRVGDHRRIGAGFDAASDLPWLVLASGIRFDRWQVPAIDDEAVGYVTVYGDRFKIMPQVDINALYRAGIWMPSVTARLHAGEFHFGLGSAVIRDFPAPRFDLEYHTPRLIMGIGIKNGAVNNALSAYYDPGKPYRYPVPLAAEDLKFGIDGRGRFQIGPLTLGGDISFLDWRTRLGPEIMAGFSLVPIHDLNELRADLFISFADKYRSIEWNQVLRFRYDKTDPVIPDEPVYDLTDSLSIGYGPAFTVLVVRYLHAREGIERALPCMLLIDPRIGLRLNSLEIFCAVFNMGDSREEIFEGYRQGSRQIAGGIGLKF